MVPDEHDRKFLRRAIELAVAARDSGERPFGAILARGDEVVAEAYDQCFVLSDPTAHAEIQVIRGYSKASGLTILEDLSLYCSAEPCVMCSGAVKWARVSRVIFSVSQAMLQSKSGGLQKPSCADIVNTGRRKVEVIGPLLETEGLKVYDSFDFAAHREAHRATHESRAARMPSTWK